MSQITLVNVSHGFVMIPPYNVVFTWNERYAIRIDSMGNHGVARLSERRRSSCSSYVQLITKWR